MSRTGLEPLTGRLLLTLFRLGLDSAAIARSYGVPEAGVANLLAAARDAAHVARLTADAEFDGPADTEARTTQETASCVMT